MEFLSPSSTEMQSITWTQLLLEEPTLNGAKLLRDQEVIMRRREKPNTEHWGDMRVNEWKVATVSRITFA